MGNGPVGGPDGRSATPPGQPPPDLAGLLDRRQAARERRDFATADAIRDQLRQAGWLVRDTPDGPELDPAPPYETLDPAAVEPCWDKPDRYEVSVVVDSAGKPEDVARATRALAAHPATSPTRCCWSRTGPGRRPAGPSRTWLGTTRMSRPCTWTRRSAS